MQFDKALSEHKDLYVFTTDRGRILFRLLDYATYKSIEYIMQVYPDFKFDLEDRIWEDCVLEHSFINIKDYLEAGLITTISQLILYLSCPRSIDSINLQLQSARAPLADAREQAILTICEAFPSYLPETLEKMSWSILVKRLAQSEIILKREFEFKSPASQQTDDSAKIFKQLDEYTDVIDFNKSNAQLQEEEFGTPKGNYNLKDYRGR